MIDEKRLDYMRKLKDKIELEHHKKGQKVTVEDIHYLGDISRDTRLANGQNVILSQELYEVKEKQVIVNDRGEEEEIDATVFFLDGEPIAREFGGEICLEEDLQEDMELKDLTEDKRSEEKSKDKDEQNLTLTEMEEERLEEIEAVTGMKKEDILATAEIDPNKEIDEKDGNTRIDEENVIRSVATKNEINPERNITAKDNFHDLFPGTEEYVKIFTVYSDKLPENGTSRFAFAGLTRDGRIEAIPMEMDRRTNSTKEMINIENTGRVDKEQVTDRLKIPGKDNCGFAFKIEQYGEISVKYYERHMELENGVEEVSETSIDLETTTRKPTPLQVREKMDARYNSRIERAEQNTRATDIMDNTGKDETTVDAIDRDSKNDLDEQVKYEGELITVEQALRRITSLYYIQDIPENKEAFEEYFEKVKQEYFELDENLGIDEKIAQMDEQARKELDNTDKR